MEAHLIYSDDEWHRVSALLKVADGAIREDHKKGHENDSIKLNWNPAAVLAELKVGKFCFHAFRRFRPPGIFGKIASRRNHIPDGLIRLFGSRKPLDCRRIREGFRGCRVEKTSIERLGVGFELSSRGQIDVLVVLVVAAWFVNDPPVAQLEERLATKCIANLLKAPVLAMIYGATKK
jgi:hypothetical protein